MVRFFNPKLLKQHKTDREQYPLAPTFTANRSTVEPLFSITLFSGMYLLIFALCQAFMVSSHGHVSSIRITFFSLLGKIVMSGLSSVKAMSGVCHLHPLTRPSLMLDVISHREKNFCFLLWFLFLQILFLWVALK